MQSTKSLPAAIDTEAAVRRSRQIEGLVKSLLAEREALDAAVIKAVGVGNEIIVDGLSSRVKQSSGSESVPFGALEAAVKAGVLPRGTFNNVTRRVVDMHKIQSLRTLGRLHPAVADLIKRGAASAAYVTHNP